MSNEIQATPEQQAQERAERLADGIEVFAAFIRKNPDIAEGVASTRWLMYLSGARRDAKEQMADIIRRALAAGATVDKTYSEKFAGAMLHFGDAMDLEVYSDRAQVCERVVVATREETIEEPDPVLLAKATESVPTVTRTEVVEEVEWVCSPLLAAEKTEAASTEPVGV